MAEQQTELEQQFEKLHQLIQQNQHAKVVRLTDNILRLSPGDVDALACKAIAQLQLGEYDEAAKVLSHKQLQGQMFFQRAYCCYRQGKFEEALKLLSQVSEDQKAAALQLSAQLYFRLDQGQSCVDACDQLRSLGQLSSLEQKTNLLAAYISAGSSAKVPELMSKLGIKPRDSFEIAYNRACALADVQEYEAAETAVKAAYKQGEEALFDEEFTEEEVLAELAPLTVLLAFLLISTGRPEAALDRLQPLVAGDLHQREVSALAANNWAVASFTTDTQQKGFFSRSIRKLESLLDKSSNSPLDFDPDISTRLNAEQKQLLHLNRALLYYLSGKLDQAKELCGQLLAVYPGQQGLTMLQALLLAKTGKAAEADQLLAALQDSTMDEDSDASIRPVLLRAQLALESGNTSAAAQLLGTALPADQQLRPGIVATRVALLEQTGDLSGADSLLQSALQHWQQASKAAPRGAGAAAAAAAAVSWCLQRLVTLKLAQGNAGDAMSLYQQLSKVNGGAASTSSAALAKLARAAASSSDMDAVAALQQQLPAAYASLGQDLDIWALEESARVIGSSRRREELVRKRDAEEAAEDEQPKHKKSKKKKKPRYPKGYDPTKPNGGLPPPDPERWLPKWQRSDAKKKQRRRRDRQETVKGSQGAGKVDEALDRGAKAERGEEPEKVKGPGKPNLPARPAAKGKGGRR